MDGERRIVKNRERITVTDFEQTATLPENADKRLAFVGRAVAVVSSERSDESRPLNIKVTNDLAAGMVVWGVRPELQARV